MSRDPHYTGRYGTASAKLRAAANANPNTRCWRCGLTLAQHPPHKTGTPAHWTAGHVNDGEVGGQLLPEASTCNYKRGAEHGNTIRAGFHRSR